jgi:hypothetical protein
VLFRNQFKNFNVLEDPIHPYPFPMLAGFAAQARTLLKGRDSLQITAAIQTADWIIDTAVTADITHKIEATNAAATPAEREQLKAEVVKTIQSINPEPDELLKSNISGKIYFAGDRDDLLFDALSDHQRLYWLKRCISQYELSDEPSSPNGTAVEYFAAVALGMIADVPRIMGPYGHIPWMIVTHGVDIDAVIRGMRMREKTAAEAVASEPTPESLKDRVVATILASNAACVAVEAVCWAEHLTLVEQKANERAVTKLKKHLTDRATLAARSSHAQDYELKEQLREWAKDNREKYKSRAAAAKAAHKVIPREVRTLENWLRAI